MSRGTSCCRNRCLPQPYYKPLVGWYHMYSFLYCQSLELKCNSVYLRNNTQSSDAAVAIIIIIKQLLKEGKEWSLSWMAWIKSIHIYSLSRIVNVLRTQACTLLKSTYDTSSKLQAFVISGIRWFPDVNHRACANNLKKCKTAMGYHQCPFRVKMAQGCLQPHHYNNCPPRWIG